MYLGERRFQERYKARHSSYIPTTGAGVILVLWHLSILLVIIVLVPPVVVGRPAWALSRGDTWLILGLALSYLVVLIASEISVCAFRWPGLLGRLALGTMYLAVLYLAALILQTVHYSRSLLIAASICVPLGLIAPTLALGRRWSRRAIVALVIIIIFAAIPWTNSSLSRADYRKQVYARTISASQQFLAATYYAGFLPTRSERAAVGGAVVKDPAGIGYFLVRGEGGIFHLDWESGELRIRHVGLKVPINGDDFDEDAPKVASRQAFRVADAVARSAGSKTTLYVSHHYWKRAEHCFVVRVSSIVLRERMDATSPQSADWRTVFESKPCLPIVEERGVPFAGQQIGGNLELVGQNELLLTLGDHQFDGWYRTRNLVRDPAADYGKTVVIDLDTNRASIFTIGHRNPQGLAVDAEGRIWSTEHGPQGGDELNLLRAGGDYGYPQQSYGTEYGSVIWPPGEGTSPYANAISPVFAWVPSIGISDLIAVADPAFERWRGDLLIASLRGRAIWRVRLEDQRVLYAEPIRIGERIRDVASGPGEIVLWSDDETIIRIRPQASVNDGSVAFAIRCGGCHDDDEHRIGPNLKGVLDRPIASADGYRRYSDGLRGLKGKWDRDRLDAFLASPREMAPGTSMEAAIPEAETRKKIIEYIQTFY